MKSINAKRIAAVAATLLVGLAAAGQGVTFGNIPIINSQGQPVVQIVVGSTAQPSDGVVAANIAAVIGSLAHTSQNVTATVNGRSSVSCVVTTPTCTLSNQQVWLGEKGVVVPTGSYSFQALIGSVLNPGVLTSGTLIYTKSIQTGSSSYNYPNPNSAPYPIVSNPTATSVYSGIGISPATSVSASTNGGGLQFTRFTQSGYDNILRLSSTQVPGLASSWGTYQESEYLWLAGFPVYNQNTGAISVLDTNGAYQISFGKPIQVTTNGQATNANFQLLGTNWTVYGMTPPGGTQGVGVGSGNFIIGGNVTLAEASTPIETVYVGHNITSGPFTVALNDLSYPNSNGLSNAALSIYNNGVLTNVTSAGPATNQQNIVVNSSGTKLYIKVSQTFPGLYAYQKWAKIQLFSNTVNVTSGKNFNSANGNNWLAALRWTTNQSTAAGSQPAFDANAALQGIILYSNQTSQVTLTAGSSFDFITSPNAWDVNFAGDSLGAPSSGNANYDPLTFTTGYQTSVAYSNPAASGSSPYTIAPTAQSFDSNGNIVAGTGTAYSINATVVTEPVNLLTVASSIPTAFQVTPGAGYASPSSNIQTLSYNLDPYQLDASFTPNALSGSSDTANILALANGGIQVGLYGNTGLPTNTVTTNNPLNVQITGYKYGQTSATTYTVTFNSNGVLATPTWQDINGLALANVTNVQISYAIPSPGVGVQVWESSNTANAITPTNAIELAQLTYHSGATLLYTSPQYSYKVAPPVTTVTYTGEQNNVNFAISTPSAGTGSRNQYFSYAVNEINVPGLTTPSSNIIFGITNSSTIDSTPAYWLNTSNGNNNAATYSSTQGTTVKALQGFRTERGGELASISTTSVVYDEPKSIDGLTFVVGPASSNTTLSTSSDYGPYTVGQSTNIPNVTIAQVNATCAFSSTSCSVTGLSNLTAVPSVSQAIVPTTLNTAVTPLAVLDSNANSASTLIVVGSKYVNSVAGQIFGQNPSFNQTFGTSSVVVQAFGTNRVLVAGYSAAQTVTAGNQFIQDLLANATV